MCKEYSEMTLEEKKADSCYRYNYMCKNEKCEKDLYNSQRFNTQSGVLCQECKFKELQAENSTMTDLLTSVLDCGYADLDVLMNCKYDISDLMDEVRDMGYQMPNLNNLAMAMFYIGRRAIQEWIDNRKDEVEEEIDAIDDWFKDNEAHALGDIADEETRKEALEEMLKALEGLEPQEDIESFHNFMDTSVYFSSGEKKEIYIKYCKDALDEFYDNTGYCLE